MFASRITKTVRTPSDPQYDVVIRRLSGRKLEKAQLAVMFGGVDLMKQLGGADVMRQIQALGGPDAVKRDAQADPSQRYDRTEILRAGIVSWAEPGLAQPDGLSSDDDRKALVDDLEEEVAVFLFREILRLSRIAVTETDQDELETAQKKG